jgi:hypothetical protein
LNRFIFCIILFMTSLIGCADTHRGGNGLLASTEKSLLGSECSPGCVWSSWAVEKGIQQLSHYCDGVGCHCVVSGDIYTSCEEEYYYEEEIVETTTTTVTTTVESYDNYNSYKGNRIADEAYYEASRRGTTGWCYNAVADAVERVTGRFLWGSHAYQAADQFNSSSHFYEVWGRDLNTLPAGAIVVWGRGTSRSGHISVALGNGQEASDHIASQMTYHYGGAPARVFLPK